MPRKIPTLGEFESRVLTLVWEHEPCTEREVFEFIQGDRDVARTTVLKTLQRLEAKGLLRREAGRPARYRAVMEQGRVLPELVRRFVNGVLGGSSEPLVNFLAGEERLSAEDLRALKRIAAKMRDDAGGASEGGER